MPSTLTEYSEAVAALDENHRRRFYETLAHNITVCVRAIWDDNQLSDGAKVDRMKWMNEILHGVVGRLRAAKPWPDTEFFEGVLRAQTDACPAIRGLIGWAVKQSYDYTAAAGRGAV